MAEHERERSSVARLDRTPPPEQQLPYRIELWDEAGENVERTLARALNAPLARAIFKAVLAEHPARRITIRNGKRMVADSRDGAGRG